MIFLCTQRTWGSDKLGTMPHVMTSHDEIQASRLVRQRGLQWVMHNERFLCRIYPGNMRVDSSNYDPSQFWMCALEARIRTRWQQTPAWTLLVGCTLASCPRQSLASTLPEANLAPTRCRVLHRTCRTDSARLLAVRAPALRRSVGVQMVALNFQKLDSLPMQLNNGLFRANGQSGYILKPTALRGHVTELAWDGSSVSVAEITVLWGEMLLYPSLRRYRANTADEALDLHPPPITPPPRVLKHEGLRPYVVLEAHGGEFAGVASSMKAVINGARFTSDWELQGFAPGEGGSNPLEVYPLPSLDAR